MYTNKKIRIHTIIKISNCKVTTSYKKVISVLEFVNINKLVFLILLNYTATNVLKSCNY